MRYAGLWKTPRETWMIRRVIRWWPFFLGTEIKIGIRIKIPGGHFLKMGYWGCAAGQGRICTTGLTIMGSPFQAFSIELQRWGRTFSGL